MNHLRFNLKEFILVEKYTPFPLQSFSVWLTFSIIFFTVVILYEILDEKKN